MSRLPYLRRDQLGPDAQALWDSIVASRGSQSVAEQGHLTGPFNAFVHAPDTGRHLDPLGAAMRFGTSLDRRLAEIAIITVAAHWKAEFEWAAHTQAAREHGIPDDAIDAIGRGEEPALGSHGERAVYAVARQLTQAGRVSQDTYDAAQRVVGDTGMVELAALCGYYTMVSFILNTFDVPLPPGTQPQWPERPGAPPGLH